MATQTVLYIIIAGIAAILLALFQYSYKSKKRKLNPVFAFLRFMTLFATALLIINPKFEKVTLQNEKPSLIVAVDNSESVTYLNHDESVLDLVESVKGDNTLNDKFDVELFSFGKSLESIDSISFNDAQTNIALLFKNIKQVYKEKKAPVVLITDGNQTLGNDYQFVAKQYNQPIFPVILGDTIRYSDLKIQQLNVNRYAYLYNQFPVEIIAVYNGGSSIDTQLIISKNGNVVHRQNINFSSEDNSRTINVTLPANTVGVESYVATITPLNSEKNKTNNSKPFAIEVIDQKTSIAIISSITHPDIGALKKSIESSEQRSVTIVTPQEYLNNPNDFQAVILYQPNSTFSSVYEFLNTNSFDRFTITGTQTDWFFVNQIQSNYRHEITGQLEDFQATLNNNFTTFIVNALDFESYPPLHSEFGAVNFNIPFEPLFYKRINTSVIDEPLMATFETTNFREVVLLGEGIWRWRAQEYLNQETFQEFDNFLGKAIQYITTNKRRTRLVVNYESFYDGNSDIRIGAQFFNKNYEFDNKASLIISLKNTETQQLTNIPFILKQSIYDVDLSNFSAGDYDFTVSANDGEVIDSGHIKILDFKVEEQFLNANVTKLQQVATNSGGSSYFIANPNELFTNLMNDQRFTTIQRSTKNVVPLIDFKILLILIVGSLTIEWFLRKYNGLI
ncbi:VWA domain-containing protein [Flavobacteriaceae sp. LMIT009]